MLPFCRANLVGLSEIAHAYVQGPKTPVLVTTPEKVVLMSVEAHT